MIFISVGSLLEPQNQNLAAPDDQPSRMEPIQAHLAKSQGGQEEDSGCFEARRRWSII